MIQDESAHLLVVEDDEMSRDMLSRRLRRRGYTVDTAESGRVALERIEAEDYDLVLLDWMMPEMTGIEVLDRIRETHPAAALPVIMVTARVESDDVVDALDRGANDYVTKPVDLRVALARIRTQISLKRSEERLREVALRDALTGLFNRHHFEHELEAQADSAKRYGHPLSLCIWDLDRYKQVNDDHGHQAGDKVLMRVGDLMRQELRRADVAARYGGDEFVMIFPHTDLEGAITLIERVRERLKGLAFIGPRGSFSVTGSFGVAEFTPGMRPADLVAAADRALYGAKSAGRDRVHSEVAPLPVRNLKPAGA